jgi:hypothetical protein
MGPLGITFNDNFYPYPNANKLVNPKIKTVYTSVPTPSYPDYLKFYINDNLAFTVTSGTIYGNLDILPIKQYYGGVHAYSIGTVLSYFKNTVKLSSQGTVDLLSQAATFVSTLLAIVVWNVDPIYLPWELNIIFIKTQLFGLIACAIAYARG